MDKVIDSSVQVNLPDELSPEKGSCITEKVINSIEEDIFEARKDYNLRGKGFLKNHQISIILNPSFTEMFDYRDVVSHFNSQDIRVIFENSKNIDEDVAHYLNID